MGGKLLCARYYPCQKKKLDIAANLAVCIYGRWKIERALFKTLVTSWARAGKRGEGKKR